MKKRRESTISSSTKKKAKAKNSRKSVSVSARHKRIVDKTTIKNNPNIDRRLLKEFERLVAASDGIIRNHKKGADYNIAHPLASKDRPADAYHRGTRASATKQS
ncbi:MAG: hypothetical protein OXP71_12185 [Candidatus Poribacteria bacterium]|nr:hypothetical protein [Candidatus Poribacteria bacterium]